MFGVFGRNYNRNDSRALFVFGPDGNPDVDPTPGPGRRCSRVNRRISLYFNLPGLILNLTVRCEIVTEPKITISTADYVLFYT